MKHARWMKWGVALLGGVALACASVAVDWDEDPEVSLGGCETFELSVAAYDGPEEWRQVASELEPALRDAIRTELAAQGLRAADAGSADLRVRARLSVEEEVSTVELAEFEEPRVGRRSPSTQTHVLVFEQATLVLEATSPEDGRVAWRGTAAAGIDPDLPLREREMRLRHVVGRILEKPPCPRAGGGR